MIALLELRWKNKNKPTLQNVYVYFNNNSPCLILPYLLHIEFLSSLIDIRQSKNYVYTFNVFMYNIISIECDSLYIWRDTKY